MFFGTDDPCSVGRILKLILDEIEISAFVEHHRDKLKTFPSRFFRLASPGSLLGAFQIRQKFLSVRFAFRSRRTVLLRAASRNTRIVVSAACILQQKVSIFRHEC